MPFENTLVILDLTREQVQRIISDAEFLESKPLYTLVTNSFVGDRFVNAYSLPPERIHPIPVSWRRPILEYVEKHGRLTRTP